FVAATHRDLRQMAATGGFREDLYFRIGVLLVRIPALRDRRSDISELVGEFTKDAGKAIDPKVLHEWERHAWPGNVRELRNAVERALAFGGDFPSAMATGRAMQLPSVPIDRPFHDVREEWIDHLEREYVRAMLEAHDGNMAAAARAAGLNRSYLYQLRRKHEI
ncbi:MAG: sigma 54-interacting transcriptional regulator, partial [Myxococcales bacterium]|nr:sigma 54-interacting transcriptional regulator [Myxococcales bacterium]